MEFNVHDLIRDKLTQRTGYVLAYVVERSKTPFYLIIDTARVILPGGSISLILAPNAELVEAFDEDLPPPTLVGPSVGDFVRYIPDDKVYMIEKAYYQDVGMISYVVTNGLYQSSLKPTDDPALIFAVVDTPEPFPEPEEPTDPEVP